MNLTPIVNQLRAYAPSFGKRVASAADYDPQAAASTSMKRPCAYVVFDGLELEESPNSQKVRLFPFSVQKILTFYTLPVTIKYSKRNILI